MEQPEKTIPTPIEFYLDYPLYQPFFFSEGHFDKGWDIRFFRGSLDSYCPECESHSIFERTPINTSMGIDSWLGNYLFPAQFKCSRNKKHELYFLFKVDGQSMQKIGQLPSMAELNLYDVKKYSGALNNVYFRELTKAIGLAAHGIGVGSFVYLRRIFEFLIEEARVEAQKSDSWNQTTFDQLRIAEKIAALSQYLPEFLVQNRAMYGILSKGIHELSEEECLKAFPIVKVGIEIILDAKLDAINRQKKIAIARKAIADLSSSKNN